MMNGQSDPTNVTNGTTKTHMRPETRGGFSRRSEVSQVVLRVFSLVGCVFSLSFMVTAAQSGQTSVYGFTLPVSAKWSHSTAFQ